MARTTYRLPTRFLPAAVWDGSTYYNHLPSGSASAHVPVCGAGTPFPAGFSWAKYDRIFRRGLLYKFSMTASLKWSNYSYTADYDPDGSGPLPISPVTYTVTPATTAHTVSVVALSGGIANMEGFATTSNPWDGVVESGEAGGYLQDDGRDGLHNPSAFGSLYVSGNNYDEIAATARNVTSAEVKGNCGFRWAASGSTISPDHSGNWSAYAVYAAFYEPIVSLLVGSGDYENVLTHGGLLYPKIQIYYGSSASLGPDDPLDGFSLVKRELWTPEEDEYGGVLQRIQAGNIAVFGTNIPVYAYVKKPYGGGGNLSLEQATASGSVAVIKYWKHANAAGDALFNQTTGEPV